MSYNEIMSELVNEPKRKEYESHQARLATFVNWPVSFLAPEQLAIAGLWYTGDGDQVRCYFCGGGFFKWERNDIPINEHRKMYPKCGFLKMISTSPVTNEISSLSKL